MNNEERLIKLLKENPEWVDNYLGRTNKSKIRTRHVFIFFSVVALIMGFVL